MSCNECETVERNWLSHQWFVDWRKRLCYIGERVNKRRFPEVFWSASCRAVPAIGVSVTCRICMGPNSFMTRLCMMSCYGWLPIGSCSTGNIEPTYYRGGILIFQDGVCMIALSRERRHRVVVEMRGYKPLILIAHIEQLFIGSLPVSNRVDVWGYLIQCVYINSVRRDRESSVCWDKA